MSAGIRTVYNLVKLKCGCELLFTVALPSIGDNCWCVRHQDYKKVISRKGSWNWKCVGCGSHGKGHPAKVMVLRNAKQHCTVTGHDVELYEENFEERSNIETVSNHMDTEPMF